MADQPEDDSMQTGPDNEATSMSSPAVSVSDSDILMEKLGQLPPKPLSGYFIYLQDNRDHPELKDTKLVSDRTKFLGTKWRALTPQERKPYQERANKMKAEFQEAMDRLGLTAADIKKTKKTTGTSSSGLELPLTRVKKVSILGANNNRCSKQATLAIAKATEIFLESLGSKVTRMLTNHKKKNCTSEWFMKVIEKDPALEFLKVSFSTIPGMIPDPSATKSTSSSSQGASKQKANSANADNETLAKNTIKNMLLQAHNPDNVSL